VVSSPKLETTGYKISMFPEEIEEIKQSQNLECPLIVDDASFSGWTSRKTMDLWGIRPESATHAFLIANTGNLGSEPGAVPLLNSLGSKVVFGCELTTPRDDGWHLKDLYQNRNLPEAFDIALLFQEAFRSQGPDSETVKSLLASSKVVDTLFPENMGSGEIHNLIAQRKFILKNGNVVNGDEVHARNPFLWASPYFQEHLDVSAVRTNQAQIVAILGELSKLSGDPEAKHESSMELKREVRRIKMNSPEGQFVGGKERR
jgi:hypothetical protein